MRSRREVVTPASARSPLGDLEEAREYFDEAARFHLSISGDEFIRRFEAGEWPDPDEDGDVMYLAMLRHIVI